MTSLALLFTLSALGISETVYLIKKRILLQKPVCPIGENCLAVLTSKYNKVLIVCGTMLSVFFTYLQFRIIKAWCFWCLMSATTIWLMTNNAVITEQVI